MSLIERHQVAIANGKRVWPQGEEAIYASHASLIEAILDSETIANKDQKPPRSGEPAGTSLKHKVRLGLRNGI